MGRIAAAIAFTLLVGVAAVLSLREPPPEDVLASALGAFRPLEGRTTVPLPYAPYEDGRRTDPDDALLAALDDGPDGRALAFFYLWRDEPGDDERAARALGGEAIRRGGLGPVLRGARPIPRSGPADAPRWNEWALLELSRGDEIAALEAIERAVSGDPGLLEALFNRGLILERLHLDGEAIEAWRAYLLADPAGPWREEAQAHLAALENAAASPGRSLEDRERKLVDELRSVSHVDELERLLAGEDVKALLEQLADVGQSYLHNEIAYLRMLPPEGWKSSHAQRRAFDQHLDALLKGSLDRAALEALAKSEDPLASIGALRILLYDAVQQSRVAEGLELSREIQRRCESLGCSLARALARSEEGSLLLARSDFDGAARAFADASEWLPSGYEVREAELLHKHAYLATKLGAFQRGVALYRQAVEIAHELRNARGLAVDFVNIASIVGEQGQVHAALAYARESARRAREHGGVRTEQIARATEAQWLAHLDRRDEALAILDRLVPEAERTDVFTSLVQALALRGDLVLDADPARARQDGRELARRAAERGDVGARIAGLKLTGRAQLRLGRKDDARRSFEEALALAEERQRAAPDPIARVRIFSRDRGLRVALARVAAPEEAWSALGERPRRRLEQDECLLALAYGDERLGLWSASAEATSYAEQQLSVDASAQEIEAAARALWSTSGCPSTAWRISVLENPVTVGGIVGRLVRLSRPDAAVAVVRSPDRQWPVRKVEGSGLAVHSPMPVIHERPMPRLPAAVEEARLVSATLPGARILEGGHATPGAVLGASPAADLIHFAVHGESRARAGASSYLLLAGESGKLQVADVLGMSLEHGPVVVLSACKGGGVTLDPERDGAGLPWAFLTAGASAVIATQDTLDDRAALDFAEAFYGALRSGAALSPAFETAVAALRAKWSPEVAAAFSLYL